jgi:DNA modification methylase
MNGEKADLLLTDPPYGMDFNCDYSGMRAGKKYDKVKGDNETFHPEPIISYFNDIKEQFWWGADYYAENIPHRNEGSWFVWDKTECGKSPNSDYDKMFGSNFELCWSRTKHKRNLIRVLWKGIFGLSKEDTKKRIHPTQKPTKLCAWFINKFSKKVEKVLDLFGGSGSTLIACEQLERNCYMMEIDPRYIDVIINRWGEYTGKKATKIRESKVLIT